MTENNDTDADKMLDWLCWVWATEGERFYPPDETAQECMDSVEDQYDDAQAYQEAHAVERGQHSRAYTTAVERFRDLENRGFNPKERAQREIERSREQGLDLDEINWDWWEESQS